MPSIRFVVGGGALGSETAPVASRREAMRLVPAALQQWGGVHRPNGSGLTEVGRTVGQDKSVRVDFVDADDAVVPADHITYRYAI